MFPPIDEYEKPSSYPEPYLPPRFYLILGASPVLAWFILAVTYPLAWGIVTAGLIILGLGLLTTKIVFGFERPLQVWGLAPVFGMGWFLLLWLLFTLVES